MFLKIGKYVVKLAKSGKLKNISNRQLKKNLNGSNIGFHGSPFNDIKEFNLSQIGSGEGFAKKGKGVYFFRNEPKYAPYFANIRSIDAPIHFGNTSTLKNPKPSIYTVSGFDKLNLKKVAPMEAKNIARNQQTFISNNPNINGIELETGEVCVFSGLEKLKIEMKDSIFDFINFHKNVKFREWTTDPRKLK